MTNQEANAIYTKITNRRYDQEQDGDSGYICRDEPNGFNEWFHGNDHNDTSYHVVSGQKNFYIQIIGTLEVQGPFIFE